MSFWGLLSAIFISVLIVFALVSVWILFVFLIRLKSNATLNKSVSKSIFKGKLSLAIILLFFGISFSFVGGVKMVTTKAENSIYKQFTDNNVFQLSMEDGVLSIEDSLANTQKIYGDNEEYVSPWIIDNTLFAYKDGSLAETYDWHASPEIFDFFGNIVNISDKDPAGDYSAFGWTYDEYQKAILQDLEYVYSDAGKGEAFKSLINDYGMTEQEIFDGVFGKTEKYATDLLVIRFMNVDEPFTNGKFAYHNTPLSSFHKYDSSKPIMLQSEKNPYANDFDITEHTEQIKKIVSDWSYTFTFNKNLTPNIGSQSKSFQIQEVNDIDWRTGNLLSDYENINTLYSNPSLGTYDLLNKRNSDNIEVNQTIYHNQNKVNFLKQSKLYRRDHEIDDSKYNTTFQSDFIQKSKNKVGNDVSITSSVDFNIFASVNFSEITIPIIGVNLLSDESRQSFVGMNLTDQLILEKEHPELFSGLTNTTFGGLNPMFASSKARSEAKSFDDLYGQIENWDNLGYNQATKYSSNPDMVDGAGFVQVMNKWFGYIGFNETDFIDFVNSLDAEKYGALLTYFEPAGCPITEGSEVVAEWIWTNYGLTNIGIGFDTYGRLSSATSFWSIESMRAYAGVVETKSTEKMINVIMYIFLAVILIVLAMLTNKRIKDSGKQLGTLKALGMPVNSIASTYIVFPLFIVGIGFLIATALSIPVMLLFQMIFNKFYYFNFAANPLSLGFFMLLLIIPMILSIGITYIVALKTLKKPTLDLLSSKGTNSPNILVRATGYVTPKWVSFRASYKFKGLLRATGKSTLLFFAIFTSTILTAFSMSSTTMITQQVNNSMKYLNVDSLTTMVGKTDEIVNDKPLWVNTGTQENPNWEEAYKADSKIKAYDPFGLLSSKTKNASLNDYTSLPTDKLVQAIDDNVWNSINEYTDVIPQISFSQLNGYETNFYIPKEDIEYLILAKSAEKSIDNTKFLDLQNEHIEANEINFTTLNKVMSDWTLNAFTNMSNYVGPGDIINDFSNLDPSKPVESLKKVFDEFSVYATDVIFGTKYYDQFSTPAIGSAEVTSYKRDVFNGSSPKEKMDQQPIFYYQSFDELQRVFGSNESKVADDIYEWLVDDWNKVNNGERIDYIPVVANEMAVQWLENQVVLGNIEKTSTNTYHVAMNLKTDAVTQNYYDNSTPKGDVEFAYDNNLAFDANIKVVGTYFSIVNIPFITLTQFIDSYFDQDYFEKEVNGINSENNTWSSDKNSIIINHKIEQTNNSPYSEDGKYTQSQEIQIMKYSVDGEQRFVKAPMSTNAMVTSEREGFNDRTTTNDTGLLPQSFIDQKNETGYVPLINATTTLSLSKYDIAKIMSAALVGNGYDMHSSNMSTYKFTLDGLNQIFGIDSFVVNPSTVEMNTNNVWLSTSGYPVKIDTLINQAEQAMQIMVLSFTVISFFAIFMAFTLIIIALKDIIDSSKREVSMLKAFGHSNTSATSLILTPYLFIIVLAFILSIPVTFLGLGAIAAILTAVTGSVFTFTLTIMQWVILISILSGLVIFLGALGYISFEKTDALEAIRETDE